MKQKQNHLALTKQTRRRQVQSGGPDNATSFPFPRTARSQCQCLGLLFLHRLQLQVPKCSKQMHPDVGVSAARQRWSGPWELSGSAHWHHGEVTSLYGNGIGASGADEDGLLEAFRVFEVLQSRDIHTEKRSLWHRKDRQVLSNPW